MAGIGFALRKLTRRDDLLGLLQAYGHSALSSTGPWMFTVLALGLLEVIGARYASLGELADFRRIIIYNFAFSLVLSGPVILIVTRYLADGIYSKSVETATGTAIGAMAFMFATQALIVVPFYLFYVNLDTTVRVAALINYFLISGIWLASVFLSALKDYKLVTRSFGLGLFIGVAGAVQLADQYSVSGLLFGFSIGLAVIVFALFARIYAEYPYDLSRPFAFLAYFRKYPGLAASGFVYSLGLWIDKFVMWTAPERSEHASGMVDYPNYDGAMFAAYLTIIPSMALFTLIIETGFYERYLRFYRGIQNHATLSRIHRDQKELISNFVGNCRNLIVLHGSICVIAILLAPTLFEALSINFAQLGIFRFGVLGAFFQMLLLFMLVMLGYFDLRRVVLGLQLLFLAANGGFTYASMQFGVAYYGFGYFLAAVVTVIVAYYVTTVYTLRLPYQAFVAQNTSVR